MNAQIASLQEQVDGLVSAINSIRNGDSFDSMGFTRPNDRSMSVHSLNSGSPYQQHTTTPRQPRFQGPTSNAFGLEVAKTTLHSLGYTDNNTEDGTTAGDDLPLPSPPMRSVMPMPTMHPKKDPIWSVPKDEAIRLCRVYEEEMGLMYPIIDIERIIRNTTGLYNFLAAAQRSGLAQMSLPGSDDIKDTNTNILKLVLACAMTVEGSGQSELGARLFESVREAVDIILHSGNFDIKDLPLLVLCVSDYF